MGEQVARSSKQVCRAIKKATGLDVGMHKEDGCISFYSDDDETGLMLCSLARTTVYVNAINRMTVDQWLENFQSILDERY